MNQERTRVPIDSVGFATEAWQMDSIMTRIYYLHGSDMNSIFKAKNIDSSVSWKVAISPHDDYSYVGYLYPAVYYGDEDWDGKNFAYFGTDEKGYSDAVSYEYDIIDSCLTGPITPDKIKQFTCYTTMEDDYKEYKWTWCGRYSIPLGLYTAYHLEQLVNLELTGISIGDY